MNSFKEVLSHSVAPSKPGAIVSVDKSGQIHAYNSTTGRLEWVVENKGLECGRFPTKRHIRLTATSGMEKTMAPEAVTADDRGHLFIWDSRNSCVQVFTIDGVYLGAILKEREKEFHLQMKARWSTATSSMVISHSPDVWRGPWKLSLVSICTA